MIKGNISQHNNCHMKIRQPCTNNTRILETALPISAQRSYHFGLVGLL